MHRQFLQSGEQPLTGWRAHVAIDRLEGPCTGWRAHVQAGGGGGGGHVQAEGPCTV